MMTPCKWYVIYANWLSMICEDDETRDNEKCVVVGYQTQGPGLSCQCSDQYVPVDLAFLSAWHQPDARYFNAFRILLVYYHTVLIVDLL